MVRHIETPVRTCEREGLTKHAIKLAGMPFFKKSTLVRYVSPNSSSCAALNMSNKRRNGPGDTWVQSGGGDGKGKARHISLSISPSKTKQKMGYSRGLIRKARDGHGHTSRADETGDENQ